MRTDRLVWWRRAVSGLAGVGGPVVVLRRRWWTPRPRVAVLAGVPLLSVGLAAGAAAAPAVSVSGAGDVTIYAGLSGPSGITAGPDGALWFTNLDSIGQITTTGTVTVYHRARIDAPEEITAGPDGALWFTNDAGSNAIGRITTAVSLVSPWSRPAASRGCAPPRCG